MAKSHLKLVAPTEVNRTVAPTRRPNTEFCTREHLAPAEVEALVEAAKTNRHGHREAAWASGGGALRPALRPSRVQRGGAAVRRVKNGTPSTHSLRGRQRARLSVHDGRLCTDDWARCDRRGPRSQGASAPVAPRLRLRSRFHGTSTMRPRPDPRFPSAVTVTARIAQRTALLRSHIGRPNKAFLPRGRSPVVATRVFWGYVWVGSQQLLPPWSSGHLSDVSLE
jgi:hypothetical protein